MTQLTPEQSLDDKEALLYQKRAELADAILESLADIDSHPDLKRLSKVSQTAADAIRIETLIGRDKDGVFHLAVQIDVIPEPSEHHVAVGFCRTVKEPANA